MIRKGSMSKGSQQNHEEEKKTAVLLPASEEVHYTRAFFCFVLRLGAILTALAILLLPFLILFSSSLRGREF